jgi:hypothetical protein
MCALSSFRLASARVLRLAGPPLSSAPGVCGGWYQTLGQPSARAARLRPAWRYPLGRRRLGRRRRHRLPPRRVGRGLAHPARDRTARLRSARRQPLGSDNLGQDRRHRLPAREPRRSRAHSLTTSSPARIARLRCSAGRLPTSSRSVLTPARWRAIAAGRRAYDSSRVTSTWDAQVNGPSASRLMTARHAVASLGCRIGATDEPDANGGATVRP